MLVFGTKKNTELAGFGTGRCRFCDGRVFGVVQTRKRFSLYWIPVLTYGRDSTAICADCGSEGYVPEGQRLHGTEYAARIAISQGN